MSLYLKAAPRKSFTSNFKKRSHFSLWPDRTRAELERLCITTEEIPPIPPQWRRIAPSQYLKEGLRHVRILDAAGRKPPLDIQLVPATHECIEVTPNDML